MVAFLLIHGGWEGAWVWRKVRPLLRAAGHEVLTPSLTGQGDRAHLSAPNIDLDTHVDDILGVIRFEELDGFVLCGHSYGGMVATSVADRVPERIASLVLLDAFAPEDGKAAFDYVPPARRAHMEGLAADHEGWRIPVLPAGAWDVVDPADVELMERLSVPHPLATLTQPARITGAWHSIGKLTYVLAGKSEPSTFRQFHDTFKGEPNWTCREIQCGHMAMLDVPETVAEILIAAIP